ncbi:MAG TPA: EAL domain-containing protein [Casimicrobiaceae bacterium]|nr:EAL domain-containing protein [Casimicrobiaceae bacterium]
MPASPLWKPALLDSVAANARTRVLRVTWPYLLIVVILAAVGGASLNVMSAVRAYVGGESLWSKAQKVAVSELERYARTRDEAHFQGYRDHASVIAGDRDARSALRQPTPDRAAAVQGFLRGGNHPADVPAMIELFVRARNAGLMTASITLWEKADGLMLEIERYANQLHAAVQLREPAATVDALVANIQRADQTLAPIEESFSSMLGDASRRIGWLLIGANLLIALALIALATLRTRRLLARQERVAEALRKREQRFDHAISGTNDGIWDWNVPAGDLYLSSQSKALLGFADDDADETVSQFARRVHPADRRSLLAAIRGHMHHNATFDLDVKLRTRNGVYRWFRVRGRSIRGSAGRLERVAGSLTDITGHKQAEAQLFEERDRAQTTLASIADAVITVDTQGRIEFLNPVAERLTGWSTTDAQGRAVGEVFAIVDEATDAPVPDPVERAMREAITVESDRNIVLMARDGEPIAIDQSVAPILDRIGNIVGAVVVFRDMRRERQYAAWLSHLASHDVLTGFLNRREFEHRLRAALDEMTEGEAHHAVLYLDLDQFKIVNDTCGHAAGDELLRQVGALLRPRLREGDTVARLGGDEFGVLLAHCPPEPALRIAETLRRTIADFRFVWQRRSFQIGVSIGLVNVVSGPRTLAGVLSAADAACYMAKEKGRNRVQVYRPEDTEITLRQGEMEWVNRLHRALADDRLCLYAQPIVGVQHRNVPRHHELLIRLQDERERLVPPMAFLPAAERYNLMPAIDRWVIRTAFASLEQRRHAGRGLSGSYAINLSGASIGDDHFLAFVREQFDRFDVPHSLICFEITETTAVTSLTKAAEFIAALRALGCQFALDDFGTGVSSFTYLKHLPVDYVKIDGSFVKDMLQDPVDAAMVEAIHRMARVMGKLTIAESAESPQHVEALRRIGVDYAQGFGIAHPALFAGTAHGLHAVH